MSTITSETFDLDRFARAGEERDAATQLSMYGPNARVTITDKISQPGGPRVLSTHEEIKAWLDEQGVEYPESAMRSQIIKIARGYEY